MWAGDPVLGKVWEALQGSGGQEWQDLPPQLPRLQSLKQEWPSPRAVLPTPPLRLWAHGTSLFLPGRRRRAGSPWSPAPALCAPFPEATCGLQGLQPTAASPGHPCPWGSQTLAGSPPGTPSGSAVSQAGLLGNPGVCLCCRAGVRALAECHGPPAGRAGPVSGIQPDPARGGPLPAVDRRAPGPGSRLRQRHRHLQVEDLPDGALPGPAAGWVPAAPG